MDNGTGRWYLAKYAALLVAVVTEQVWSDMVTQWLQSRGLATPTAYFILLGLVSLIVVGPDVWKLLKGVVLALTRGFSLAALVILVESSSRHRGKPTFYIERDDQNLFQVAYEKRITRVKCNIKRYLFNAFPVIYYNMTAKSHLHWIDYLYLRLLRDLREKLNAKIIIALHFDEYVYVEGYFTERTQHLYSRLRSRSIELINKVLGTQTSIIDEHWHLSDKRGTMEFARYFFGVFIAKLNSFAGKLSRQEIEYGEFYRIQTNLISAFPAICLAKRHGNLFVLDYEGSLNFWGESPFSDFKSRYNMFFIKSAKVGGPNGERLPTWSEDDSINLTDDTHTIKQKLDATNEYVLSAMYEMFFKGQRKSRERQAQAVELYEEIVALKKKLAL